MTFYLKRPTTSYWIHFQSFSASSTSFLWGFHTTNLWTLALPGIPCNASAPGKWWSPRKASSLWILHRSWRPAFATRPKSRPVASPQLNGTGTTLLDGRLYNDKLLIFLTFQHLAFVCFFSSCSSWATLPAWESLFLLTIIRDF